MPGFTPRNSSISTGLRPGSSLRSVSVRSGASTSALNALGGGAAAGAAGAGAGPDLQAAQQASRSKKRFMAVPLLLDEVVIGRAAAPGEEQAIGAGVAVELVHHLRRDHEVPSGRHLVRLPVELQRPAPQEQRGVLRERMPVRR